MYPNPFAVLLTAIGLQHSVPSARIINGHQIAIARAPYQVRVRAHLLCGGVIVAPTFVLTTAHCFMRRPSRAIDPIGNFTVVAGAADLDAAPPPASVKTVHVHPAVLIQQQDILNDLAVLELAEALAFGAAVRAAALPAREPAGRLLVSGWGRVGDGPGPVAELRAVEVGVVGRGDCYNIEDKLAVFCARSVVDGVGFCDGDSGGPAVSENGTVYGLVSYRWSNCTAKNTLGYYVNVYHLLPFIKNVTGL